MARVNSGIFPFYLTDQHLIAESVEITMITGSLKQHNFKIKSEIPSKFSLGKGHVNFFKNKLLYLKTRLELVNSHLDARGIKHSTVINQEDYPSELWNDWTPTMEDSKIVRDRIAHRLWYPLKARKNFHRWYKEPIDDILDQFVTSMIFSQLNDK